MRGTLAARVARLDDGGAPFLFNGPALPYWLTHSRADATPRATYFGSDGVLKTVAAAGDPRIDFTPGKRPGLLVESARTNLALNANDFAAASWSLTNASATANAGGAPTGAAVAAKLAETAASGFHMVSQNVAGAGQNYTCSIFLKQVERGFAALAFASDGGTKRQTLLIDLATGAVVGSSAAGAPVNPVSAVAPAVNGFWRLWVKLTNTLGFVQMAAALSDSAAPTFASAIPTYLGVAGAGVFCFGAQLEAGSYPTSYVATGAAAVTRAADALSMAARATDPLIVQTRSLADGARARTLLNPASDISTLADVVIEGAKLYPAGTPGASLASKLFVDGPW
ncbi:hypothetical protein [Methylocystis sp.]|uniref:phage head spike fiber domain-containing protein n=1 Tax=Methylocystis sp. TaxID=1911079 RepID=UPI0027345C1D|nr:hypothetical protein [Methylocystis sp.]MDP3554811.1 hypothetical protein [Methylocystis sp.]